MSKSNVRQGERTDPPKAPVMAPQGSSGLDHGWGQINEEQLLQLKGPRAMREFREMHDNCAIVGGITRLAEEMIKQTEWSVRAAGDDPTDLLGKHILETSLTDMKNTWGDFISEVLTMGPFGHAYMEMWFKKRFGDSALEEFRSQYNDGYYGIGNIQLRAQESLDRWNIADDGDILGMWQRPAPTYQLKYIDMHRALLFRTTANKNNPEGRSWYRPAWRSWYFVKRLQELEGIGIERDVSGYPDYQMPPEYFLADATSEQKAALEEAKKMVTRVRQDKYMGLVRPSEVNRDGSSTGHKFSLIQGGSRNAGVFDVIIKRYESRIAIALLGEFMLLGQDKVGSFALSSDKTHMFAIALGAVLRRIEDVINRDLSPRLMRANGLSGSAAPKLEFSDIEQENVLPMAQAVSGLVGAGILTPDDALERYLRSYMSLPMVGEVSHGQLEDAFGSANERIENAEDPVSEDVQEVEAALDAAEVAEAPNLSMSAQEAAEMAGVPVSTIMRAIRNGKLPGAKLGNKYRIMRDDFTLFMRNEKRPTQQELF